MMGLFKKLLGVLGLAAPEYILIQTKSMASERLKADVLDFIRGGSEQAGEARGAPLKVIDTEVLEVSPNVWCRERWHVECGGRVAAYDIRFSDDGRGGTHVDVCLHPATNPPVPTIKRTGPMRLSSERLGELMNVTAADIERVFSDNSFGQFITLADSDESFIQAASNATSFDRYGFDPWLLEYRDGTSGKQFQSRGDLALVKQAFLSYLRGGADWHGAFTWEELPL